MEEEIVEVSDSEDKFEVFNRPESPKVPSGDFSNLPLAKVNHIQEEGSSIPKGMGIQCRARTSLHDLLKSQARGNIPKKIAQPQSSTLPSTHTSQADPADKKRKRDPKGKEVVEERRTVQSR